MIFCWGVSSPLPSFCLSVHLFEYLHRAPKRWVSRRQIPSWDEDGECKRNLSNRLLFLVLILASVSPRPLQKWTSMLTWYTQQDAQASADSWEDTRGVPWSTQEQQAYRIFPIQSCRTNRTSRTLACWDPGPSPRALWTSSGPCTGTHSCRWY